MSTAATKARKEAEKRYGVRIPLQDATKPMSFAVTLAECEGAMPGTSDACAAAMALRATNRKTVAGAWAHPHSVVLHLVKEINGKKRHAFRRYIPEEKLRKQIKRLDDEKTFTPGTYILLPPAGAQTLKAVNARSTKRPGRHEPGNTGIKRKPRRKMRVAWSGK